MSKYDYEEPEPRHKKRRIDKNKYCRRNKLEKGKFGIHEFIDKKCIYCGKPESGSRVVYLNLGELRNE